MIYNLGSGKMIPCGVHENETKNNLPMGTVLHLNGYDYHDSVIVKNLGINERFSDCGAKYIGISLVDYGQQQYEAYTLKYISQKQDGRIQTYITDKVLTPDEVLEIWEKSEAKRKRMNEAAQERTKLEDDLEIKGKELFKKHIPETAKALIVAVHDSNDSDSQSDYFAHKTTGRVILGYSAHKRDLFSEMRKVADKIPETTHLKTATTEAEHREKYSMGGGYYLKAGYRHDTGWKIEKVTKWRDDWDKDLYISIAKRCIL